MESGATVAPSLVEVPVFAGMTINSHELGTGPRSQ